MEPLFSDVFLARILSEFKACSITGIRDITLIINSFIVELESGKLEKQKEEEIKSRFINSFFGDVLGFNYGNSNEWQLREEKKSVVDGKKADAALGYFYGDKMNDDVRVVIEIKDAGTDLDTKQKRDGKLTPIEQAFMYVPKMGGNCKWIVLSNIKETRFYCSNDSSKCQVFYLKDLNTENKRNELLLLFHKDRFIKKKGESATELLISKSKLFIEQNSKPLHLIDEIDRCLRRFAGFGFVDPDYLATLYPFNILAEHVWHYHDRNLFTINNKFYDLLNGISIENNEVVFTNEIKLEIEAASVVDAKEKIENAFKFLNRSLIYEIVAIKNCSQVEERNKGVIGFSRRHHFNFKEGEDGITKNIYLLHSKECDCLSCNYRSLNFKKLLEKLKAGVGNADLNTLEYAYGNYLTASNNFKTTYSIYKAIEKETKGKEGNEITYFLTKYNIKLLHNLILDYQYSDNKEILNDIKAVDLDKVIYDEIEFSVDSEVKRYLIDVKEDVLILKLQDEIEEIIFKIDKLKELYEKGGTQSLGPSLPYNLAEAYFNLYLHTNRNYIIYDNFRRYKYLTEKVFKGLITIFQTKEHGVIKFDDFFLTEAILHITPDNLEEILKPIELLPADDVCIEKILEKLNNFTSSYVRDTFFGDPETEPLIKEYLGNFRFKNNFVNILANQFVILSRLRVTKGQFGSSKKLLIRYLKVETELAWFHLKHFCMFISKKGNLFEATELIDVLRIAIDGDKYGFNKYTELIKAIARAIHCFFPDYKIDDLGLIQSAILKCSSSNSKNSNYQHLVPLVRVCAEDCKKALLSTFEIELNKNFNDDMYEALLKQADYDYNRNNYFQIYVEYINSSKGGRAYKYGKQKLTDLVFFNFAYVLYQLNISFDRSELRLLTHLNDFETWLVNPLTFDYSRFDAKWLLEVNDPIFISRFMGNQKIKTAIEAELDIFFEPVLAEIRYKHFRE